MMKTTMLVAAVLAALMSGCGGGDAAQPGPLAAQAPRAHAAAAAVASGCPTGTVLMALTPDAGQARLGSVYSSTLYDPTLQSGNTTHQPRLLKVKATLNGQPVAGCRVDWSPAASSTVDANGWVYAPTTTTDTGGQATAWWTAGTATSQSLRAQVLRGDATTSAVTITGSAYPHSTRANSIHVSWSTPAWQKFSAEVTPHSWPATTYYEVIGFNGGYGGIQSQQLLFSLWDVGGVSPVVVDAGISQCTNFGGEGTGIKCEAAYTPQAGVTYRFELEVAAAAGGKQDYSMYFTDPVDGQRKKLGTLRLPQVLAQSGAYGFVEDWATEATSCLDNPVRAATYGRVRYQNASGQWVDVTAAQGDAVYTPNHNEVCANYRFASYNAGQFTLSTGGRSVGQPLNLPGGDTRVNLPAAVPALPAGVQLLHPSVAPGLSLDIPYGSSTPGSDVQIYPSHGGASQQWQAVESPAGSGLFVLKSPSTGLVLAPIGGNTAYGVRLVTATPTGASAQRWRLVATRPGFAALVHADTGSVLDTRNGAGATGTTVFLTRPNNSPGQEWRFEALNPS